VSHDIHAIPDDIPRPVDDGACRHLTGRPIPSLPLPATTGEAIDLSAVSGRAVVFAYPRTGRPGRLPLVADWDRIPGARGCTPQTCGFRDHHDAFAALGVRVFGLSTQPTDYQREMAERLGLRFPVLSDVDLRLTRALALPTFTVAGETLLRRLAWIARDGVIERVLYPVFPPDENAAAVLHHLTGGVTP
jgi:peroxiredoxin